MWSTVVTNPVETLLNISPLGILHSIQAMGTGYSYINKSEVPFGYALAGSIPFFGAGIKAEKVAVKAWTVKARIKEYNATIK